LNLQNHCGVVGKFLQQKKQTRNYPFFLLNTKEALLLNPEITVNIHKSKLETNGEIEYTGTNTERKEVLNGTCAQSLEFITVITNKRKFLPVGLNWKRGWYSQVREWIR